MKIKAISLAVALSVSSLAYAETHEEKIKRLEAELNSLADVVEQQQEEKSAGSFMNRTKIGGYGELHYNDIDGSDAEIDFHRFVLFFNHEFNDRVRLFSELELEHSFAGDGKPGEVELEQAYVEFDINKQHSAKGGLFLVPVGLLNETHEPPTFYGVERNPVEKNIIPTTWWEAGAGLSGRLGENGLSYDVALTSGLKVDTTGTTLKIRGGRQSAAEAVGENLAVTGRLKYTGIAGLELAGTLHVQDDITQVGGDGVEGATLAEAHAVYENGKFGARALYAAWDIDVTNPTFANQDKQDGFYVEGSYKITPKVGVFARHASWSTQDGVDNEQQNFGVSYFPHENVVVKADIQQQNADAGDGDGYNLGIGYHF